MYKLTAITMGMAALSQAGATRVLMDAQGCGGFGEPLCDYGCNDGLAPAICGGVEIVCRREDFVCPNGPATDAVVEDIAEDVEAPEEVVEAPEEVTAPEEVDLDIGIAPVEAPAFAPVEAIDDFDIGLAPEDFDIGIAPEEEDLDISIAPVEAPAFAPVEAIDDFDIGFAPEATEEVAGEFEAGCGGDGQLVCVGDQLVGREFGCDFGFIDEDGICVTYEQFEADAAAPSPAFVPAEGPVDDLFFIEETTLDETTDDGY